MRLMTAINVLVVGLSLLAGPDQAEALHVTKPRFLELKILDPGDRYYFSCASGERVGIWDFPVLNHAQYDRGVDKDVLADKALVVVGCVVVATADANFGTVQRIVWWRPVSRATGLGFGLKVTPYIQESQFAVTITAFPTP